MTRGRGRENVAARAGIRAGEAIFCASSLAEASAFRHPRGGSYFGGWKKGAGESGPSFRGELNVRSQPSVRSERAQPSMTLAPTLPPLSLKCTNSIVFCVKVSPVFLLVTCTT